MAYPCTRTCQFCYRYHSSCSCLNGSGVFFMFSFARWGLFLKYAPLKCLLKAYWEAYHIRVECMFIPPPLSQAQPVHRQPISYPVTFATPHRVRRAQGACVRGRLCVSVCVCLMNSCHVKTRALVWNLAQFVKNVIRKKKTLYLRHRVLFLLSQHLLSTSCFD